METFFNPTTHDYFIDNIPVPSVTGVINDVFGERPYWNDYVKSRGKALHLATQFYDAGELDFDTVDQAILGRLNGYIKFRESTGYEVIDSEKQLYSEKLMFAGTYDRTFKCNGSFPILGDIKSSYDPTALIQLGAYCYLFEETEGYPINYAAVIELFDNRTYKLQPEGLMNRKEIKRHINLFKSCLSIYNFKKNNHII